MAVYSYCHAFTIEQLKIIIGKYMNLSPYFECLQLSLKQHIQEIQFRECEFSSNFRKIHNEYKPHPIKIPILGASERASAIKRGDIENGNYKGDYAYVYPLEVVKEVLDSSTFYQQLPRNIIVNGLLTTTNIAIIKQVLTILSESLSKLIKSTLLSLQEKQLTNYINELVSDCLPKGPQSETDEGEKSGKSDLDMIGLIFAKGFDKLVNGSDLLGESNSGESTSEINTIAIDTVANMEQVRQSRKETEFPDRKKPSRRSSIVASILNQGARSKELMGSQKDLKSQKQIIRTIQSLIFSQGKIGCSDKEGGNPCNERDKFVECGFCQNYRSYLLESTGLSYFHFPQINKMNPEAIGLLNKLKDLVTIFTLHLKETNKVTIPAKLSVINSILEKIGLIVSEQNWQQNSNTDRKPRRSVPKNQQVSLLSELEPFFDKVYNYRFHSRDQMTIDQLMRVSMKAQHLKDVKKQIISKYLQESRREKEGMDLETICIPIQKLSTGNLISAMGKAKGKSEKCKLTDERLQNSQLFEARMLKQYESKQYIISEAKAHSKPLHNQISEKQQEMQRSEIKVYYNNRDHERQRDTMECQEQSKMQWLVKDEEIIDTDRFNIILYQQWMRNQGFNITKNNLSTILSSFHQSKNFEASDSGQQREQRSGDKNALELKEWSFFDGIKEQSLSHSQSQSQSHSQSQNCVLKTKKNSCKPKHLNTNFSPNCLLNQSNFKNKLTSQSSEAEYFDTNYEKKQNEIYNKMLLNGETIKNEIINEIEYEQAVIYESYEEILNESITQIIGSAQDTGEPGKNIKKYEDQNGQNQDNSEAFSKDNIFLTTFGSAQVDDVDLGMTQGSKFKGPNAPHQNTSKGLNFQKSTNNKQTGRLKKKYSNVSICFRESNSKLNKTAKNYEGFNDSEKMFFEKQNREEICIKKPEWIAGLTDLKENPSKQESIASAREKKAINNVKHESLMQKRMRQYYQNYPQKIKGQKRFIKIDNNRSKDKENLSTCFKSKEMNLSQQKDNVRQNFSKQSTVRNQSISQVKSRPISALTYLTSTTKSKSRVILSKNRLQDVKIEKSSESSLLAKIFREQSREISEETKGNQTKKFKKTINSVVRSKIPNL